MANTNIIIFSTYTIKMISICYDNLYQIANDIDFYLYPNDFLSDYGLNCIWLFIRLL